MLTNLLKIMVELSLNLLLIFEDVFLKLAVVLILWNNTSNFEAANLKWKVS